MGLLLPVPRWSIRITRNRFTADLSHDEDSKGRGAEKPGPPRVAATSRARLLQQAAIRDERDRLALAHLSHDEDSKEAERGEAGTTWGGSDKQHHQCTQLLPHALACVLLSCEPQQWRPSLSIRRARPGGSDGTTSTGRHGQSGTRSRRASRRKACMNGC